MSDQQNAPVEKGIVKSYLCFLDNNVLFKKPISCLNAIGSLLIPVVSLILLLQIARNQEAKFIIASILIFLVLAFAGILGAQIWWYRRINRDEGSAFYPNFRRFIQTSGEWSATFIAISVFGTVIIVTAFSGEYKYLLEDALPGFLSTLGLALAFLGPVAGFVIIILTKIFLFLLDPVIWLIKWLWGFIVRIAKFCYRNVINLSDVVEKNTPLWFGAIWVLAIAVIVVSLVMCFTFGGIAPVIALIFALAFMAYLVFKKKQF